MFKSIGMAGLERVGSGYARCCLEDYGEITKFDADRGTMSNEEQNAVLPSYRRHIMSSVCTLLALKRCSAFKCDKILLNIDEEVLLDSHASI